jgi:hypothetical protein
MADDTPFGSGTYGQAKEELAEKVSDFIPDPVEDALGAGMEAVDDGWKRGMMTDDEYATNQILQDGKPSISPYVSPWKQAPSTWWARFRVWFQSNVHRD